MGLFDEEAGIFKPIYRNHTTAWMQELAGAVAAQGNLFSDGLPDHSLASQLNILTKRVFSIECNVANSHVAPCSGAQLNIPGITIRNHLPVTVERNGYPRRFTVMIQPLWIIS